MTDGEKTCDRWTLSTTNLNNMNCNMNFCQFIAAELILNTSTCVADAYFTTSVMLMPCFGAVKWVI